MADAYESAELRSAVIDVIENTALIPGWHQDELADEILRVISSSARGDIGSMRAVERMAYGYELMHHALCHIAGTSGASCHWYTGKAYEITSRVSPVWAITKDSNPSKPGDCLSGYRKFLRALSDIPVSLETEGVRPLVWKEDHGVAMLGPYRLFEAETPLGRYVYGTDAEGVSYYHTASSGIITVRDEAKAKRLAEAAWEKAALAEIGKYSHDAPPEIVEGAVVCTTCQGVGLIGGLVRWGDGDVDSVSEGCPDCLAKGTIKAPAEGK